jgi:hypothetical protein
MKTKLQKNSYADKPKTDLSGGSNGHQMELLQICGKPVTATFTDDKISSNGGLLLLREVENRLGLVADIASVIGDDRDGRYVHHTVEEILTQRVAQIAAGYEDANDCDTLRDDPAVKMVAGRAPETGEPLASQPTMSRFENSVSRTDLFRIALVFAKHFVRSYAEEPQVVVIDMDDTNSNAHGGQQLTLFSNYYKEYCYMPTHIYEGISGKLITTVLKPGRMAKAVDVHAIIHRVITFLRGYWKNTLILVRGDAHFTSHPLMDWAQERENVHFVTGLIPNKKLKRLAADTIDKARQLYEETGRNIKLYESFTYRAKTWGNDQRVVVKVEHTAAGSNVRYVVTDLWEAEAQDLYEKCYCARGRMELNIKDHKTYLKSDRTSCHRFEANQFRLFLHSAAYVLLHTLKTEVLRATALARATMRTLQLKLIKVAVKVKEYKTRIKLEFPAAMPEKQALLAGFEIFRALRC